MVYRSISSDPEFPMSIDLQARYRDERLPRYTSYPDGAAFLAGRVGPTVWRLAGIARERRDRDRSTCTSRSAARCAGIAAATPRSPPHDDPIVDYLAVLRGRSSWSPAARSPLAGRPYPFRRRHADDHGAGELLGSSTCCCAGIRSSSPRRPRSRSRSTRARSTPAMIEALGRGGVNRASLGVQSFDPVVQRAINRVQTFAQTAAAADGLRAAGVSRHQLRPDLRPAAPDRRVLSRHRRGMPRAEARPFRGVRLCACSQLQETPAHDRRGRAARRRGAARAGRSDRGCAAGGRISADRSRSFRPAGRSRWSARTATDACGAISRATRPTVRTPCSASALPPSAACRKAMSRTRSASATMRRAIGAGTLPTVKGYVLTADDRLRAEI